ncbi:uncharacterized protein A4U43_C06F3590 [Asparagus officinalis]|uniref:Uncharacterized protein n=1 Tax=Asparagus officinalis TaxID=4686 RepID=A0A5P1EJT9_ASPOF|nr:uncharacterized protein A4U43_C06F3590 [Asparagus officinalis]
MAMVGGGGWWLGSEARRSEFGYGADGELGSESLVRGVREEVQTAAWADPPAAGWGVGELDGEGLGGRSSLGGRRENEMKRERRTREMMEVAGFFGAHVKNKGKNIYREKMGVGLLIDRFESNSTERFQGLNRSAS